MDKHIIKQILLEQRDEVTEIFKGRIVCRDIELKAKEMLDSNMIKVIMGIRRCGKSTLAHQLLRKKNYGYVNFDDERLVGVRSGDLNDILEILKEIEPDFKYLLLDEIQNIDNWELFVNRLKRAGYNIIITGSNSKLLSRELASHLTGRHFSIELYPFSFREFLCYQDVNISENDFFITERKANLKRLLNKYLELGGIPETYSVSVKGNYLRELFDKIITRDIVTRYNIKFVRDLKELSLFAISNFASRITYHKIRNIFEIKSVHTVKNYLTYLEEVYLLFQISPFSFKLKEQLKRPRKVYCIDFALINSLIPRTTLDYGKNIENVVFPELRRREKEIYFYYQPGYELDFLIKEGLKVKQLIQVCYSTEQEETRTREIKALLKSSEELKCNDLIIITWDDEKEDKIASKIIKIIPLWKWLLIEDF